MGPNGQVIFVGTTDTKVYSVTVDAASGVAKDVSEFAPSIPKKLPSGVCFAKDGTLYVAEINQVLAFPCAEAEYQNPSITAKVIVAQDKLIPAERAKLITCGSAASDLTTSSTFPWGSLTTCRRKQRWTSSTIGESTASLK